MNNLFHRVKEVSKELLLLTDEQRSNILLRIAERAESSMEQLLLANSIDLQKLEKSNPLYDRLLLTPERITSIVADLRKVASLPSPLGLVSKERTLPNGLYLRRVSVPFGVIGVIFEARPNVCFDVFSICFKSGNACVLKGSHTAEESNRAIIALIHDVLRETGVPTDVLALLPPTHEATANLLAAVGYVDLCIPRGGKKLIEFVRDNARVPVIETGAGVVHAYFDKDGDIEKGRNIIANAKMRRVSVCNALDCLLVHSERVADIPSLIEPMKDRVDIITDEATMGTEWMDYKMSLKIVNSIDDALAHIARYGSGHSECIITENEATAAHFQKMVDAACVYVNAPTSFTDGAQFGMGAEIGISTQKLGPRGPMALEEMTTYKWLINGDGQIRE
ncbi:MAG: glutamate-5-semialdehyde dehydrogenase [Bacteroidaceae bacterium]|nr:glutamate-5-semialdehyde dehydrogenase [Bacteroidaceae bacterium]